MRSLLRLIAGLIAWAAAFCVIYGIHGVGCARGWDTNVLRAVLLVAWAAAAAATLSIALRLTRRRSTALDRAALATGWTGFAATIVTFLPVAVVPLCT